MNNLFYNQIDLKGKVAVITGGASGAGKEIAKVFAMAGADIVITYNSSYEAAMQYIKELNEQNVQAKAYQMDLSDISMCEKVLDEINSDFGHIDILVNNAGIYPAKPIDQISKCDWDNMLDINTKSVFFICRKAYHLMKENGGNIVNISSINATNPNDNLVHYGVSKTGVEMLTRSLAQQFGPTVRVNCVAPGLINRQGIEQAIPNWVESYSERSPLHRLVEAEEIGKACLFFASSLSSGVTGQTLTVDCGIINTPCFNNN